MVAQAWLEGVRTFDGRPAAARACSGTAGSRRGVHSSSWMVGHKIPVGDAMAVAIDYIKTHGTALFDGISIVIRGRVDGVTACCAPCPAAALIARHGGLAWVLRRSWTLAVFVALALLFILNQGYWLATLETCRWSWSPRCALAADRRAVRHRRRASAAACTRRCGRCSI